MRVRINQPTANFTSPRLVERVKILVKVVVLKKGLRSSGGYICLLVSSKLWGYMLLTYVSDDNLSWQ